MRSVIGTSLCIIGALLVLCGANSKAVPMFGEGVELTASEAGGVTGSCFCLTGGIDTPTVCHNGSPFADCKPPVNGVCNVCYSDCTPLYVSHFDPLPFSPPYGNGSNVYVNCASNGATENVYVCPGPYSYPPPDYCGSCGSGTFIKTSNCGGRWFYKFAPC